MPHLSPLRIPLWALLLTIAVALSPPAFAASRCEGGIITETTLGGCDASCASHEALHALFDTLPRGRPLQAKDLSTFIDRLDASQLAQEHHLSCSPGAGGTALHLEVQPMTFVRRLDIEGNDIVRLRDLRKRIFLRTGTPLLLNPEAPEEAEPVSRQLETFRRTYQQAGLDGVQIGVRYKPVDAVYFDLVFVIEEGTRRRIETFDVIHVHHGQSDTGEQACPTIEPPPLRRLSGLNAGDVWTKVLERKTRDQLRQGFQAAGYERPRVEVHDIGDDSGAILFQVTTERCWDLRIWERELEATGEDMLSFRWRDPVNLKPERHRTLETAEAVWRRTDLHHWAKTLPFGESGSFDLGEAARGVDAIASELRAQGYPFAEVKMSHRHFGHDGSQRNEVVGAIDYYITRNIERRIQRIRFEGRRTPAHERLLKVLKTEEYDFLGQPGAFDEARVFADLEALASWYHERGYFDFKFVRPQARAGYEQIHYGTEDRLFTLERDLNVSDIVLVIAFDEGPQARLTEFQVQGADSLSDAELTALMGLRGGGPWGPKYLRDGLERLVQHYRRHGMHHAKLQPECQINDAPVDCQEALDNGRTDLSLHLQIHEGPVVKIAGLTWRGNAETDSHILLRDLPKVGDTLNFDRINEGIRKMRAIGIFNSVRVDVDGLDDPDNPEVILIIQVEETRYRFLDVALGVRSIQRANIGQIPAWAGSGAGILVGQSDAASTGFGRAFPLRIPDLLMTFDFEYIDLNPDGRGNRLQIPFGAGFSLSQFLRLATFNPSYTFPRFLDSDLTLILRGVAEFDRVTDPLDRLEFGVESDLIVPISEQMSTGVRLRAGMVQLAPPGDLCINCLTAPPIGYGTNVPQDLIEQSIAEAICADNPTDPACEAIDFRPQFTLGLRWRWDNQDTPLHPTRGIALTASTSFILDRDRLSASPTFNEFIKWDASARFALSLNPIVIAAFVHYGGAATFNQPYLPANERFTLGGSNGMRGFADNSICRYDKDGNLDPTCPEVFGGNVVINGSVEVRVPLFTSAGLWLGAFFDWGALAKSHDELYWSSVRMSAGVGVRWLLGGLFPVRLDIGFPLLERRCMDWDPLGACIREEASQIHFGLLYTF